MFNLEARSSYQVISKLNFTNFYYDWLERIVCECFEVARKKFEFEVSEVAVADFFDLEKKFAIMRYRFSHVVGQTQIVDDQTAIWKDQFCDSDEAF